MLRPVWWFAALVVFVVAVAALWGHAHLALLATFHLDKEQADFWDDAIKALAGFGALIGGLVAVTKYLDEKSKENNASLIEAQKPFLEKRQQVYSELVRGVAFLGNNPRSDPSWASAKTQARNCYWGDLALVD